MIEAVPIDRDGEVDNDAVSEEEISFDSDVVIEGNDTEGTSELVIDEDKLSEVLKEPVTDPLNELVWVSLADRDEDL